MASQMKQRKKRSNVGANDVIIVYVNLRPNRYCALGEVTPEQLFGKLQE